MPEDAKEQQKNLAERSTAAIAKFIGSWWAIIFHTLWFIVWLIFDFSLEILTLWVSLEAIFIGIFLLMASNRAEAKRDKKEAAEQLRQRKMIGVDISMDRKQTSEMGEIRGSLKKLEKQIAHLTKLGLDKREKTI